MAVWFKSDHQREALTDQLLRVVCLSLDSRVVPDGFNQVIVAEPRQPFERNELFSVRCFPWHSAMIQLGPVRVVGGLSQGDNVTVS